MRAWVMVKPGSAPRLVSEAARRGLEIVDALKSLDDDAFLARSLLPGWSSLTIACHLRYTTQANLRVTADAIAGRPAAFYPDGRSRQRPTTLVPKDDEQPADVVASLESASVTLNEAWASLGPDDWGRPVIEPSDNPDLGELTLATLALLRLTEVEVHGTDLGLGLSDWSATFVSSALPFRMNWLSSGQGVRGSTDAAIRGSWLLAPAEGPGYLVAVTDGGIHSEQVGDGVQADVTVEGTSRDLLAYSLGRPPVARLSVSGDAGLARAFKRAFPGP